MVRLSRIGSRLSLALALLLSLAVLLAGCGKSANSSQSSDPANAGSSGNGAAAPATGDSGSSDTGAAAKPKKIGISKYVEHPALDAAEQGFKDYLKEHGYADVEVETKSAQAEAANTQTIATDFVNSGVDLILAIATPSAVAAAQATDSIPVLFTAVTDPVDAKLVESLDRPGHNVTGTSDMNPVHDQLDLFNKLNTGAKKIGIIYNSGEPNSVIQVNMAKEAAAQLGLEILEAVAATQTDVLTAAQSLIGKVDGIYVPTDNTVVSAAGSVIQVAEQQKWPVIAGESSVVEAGGLATVGIDYYQLGYQTGRMAVEVLEGGNPAEMPVQYQEQFTLTVNKKAAERIGLELPADMFEGAQVIEK